MRDRQNTAFIEDLTKKVNEGILCIRTKPDSISEEEREKYREELRFFLRTGYTEGCNHSYIMIDKNQGDDDSFNLTAGNSYDDGDYACNLMQGEHVKVKISKEQCTKLLDDILISGKSEIIENNAEFSSYRERHWGYDGESDIREESSSTGDVRLEVAYEKGKLNIDFWNNPKTQNERE